MIDSTQVIDLGNSMFCDIEEKVINWKGDNFYKACGQHVGSLPGGGTSSCVLPIGHKYGDHIDYDGRSTVVR